MATNPVDEVPHLASLSFSLLFHRLFNNSLTPSLFLSQEYLLIGFECGLLSQWNLKSRSLQRSYSPRKEGLLCGGWYADGQRMAVGYSTGEVREE